MRLFLFAAFANSALAQIGSSADPCAGNLCSAEERCQPKKDPCVSNGLNGPCPKYECIKEGNGSGCPDVGWPFGSCENFCSGDESCPKWTEGQYCCPNGCCSTPNQTPAVSKCLTKCPAHQECVFAPVLCFIQPCQQYQCKDKPNQCPIQCAANQDCVYNPFIPCLRAPCPLYECRTRTTTNNDVCDPACNQNEKCVTTSHYRHCVPISRCEPECQSPYEKCVYSPKHCFTTPCPQYDCVPYLG